MTDQVVLTHFPATRADGTAQPHVALVTLNRPQALNAINSSVITALVETLEALDADAECRAIVIRGSGERAFAAGADIREMADATPLSPALTDQFGRWDHVKRIRTPLIAAVRGYALGGGCELAMTCDMIVAGEDAQFGQPEIKLGVMPGAGGTQRLTRAIGPARATELILTGRTMGADEALGAGFVTRVVPAAATVDAALELAARIAAMPPLAVRAAKRSIRAAAELPLAAGLAAERQAFFALFGSHDQREGMAAFIEKRQPEFRNK